MLLLFDEFIALGSGRNNATESLFPSCKTCENVWFFLTLGRRIEGFWERQNVHVPVDLHTWWMLRGECVGGGVLLGRMLRSCTRFQVSARMTCCWPPKSCCYVSETLANMARNAYCKTNMLSSPMSSLPNPQSLGAKLRQNASFRFIFEKMDLDSSNII